MSCDDSVLTQSMWSRASLEEQKSGEERNRTHRSHKRIINKSTVSNYISSVLLSLYEENLKRIHHDKAKRDLENFRV